MKHITIMLQLEPDEYTVLCGMVKKSSGLSAGVQSLACSAAAYMLLQLGRFEEAQMIQRAADRVRSS